MSWTARAVVSAVLIGGATVTTAGIAFAQTVAGFKVAKVVKCT